MPFYLVLQKKHLTFAPAFISESIRGVAQPGSAPGLGPGGRRFESCRPDLYPRGQINVFNLAFSVPNRHYNLE